MAPQFTMDTKYIDGLVQERRNSGTLAMDHPSNFKVTWDKNIGDFEPNWVFSDCKSNFDSLMALEWWTKLEVV